ncbi:MAG: glycosyltransferase [Muribaculaceae bacterium]|nr:glycosyltransferase [Muribaculaceae bacterium]
MKKLTFISRSDLRGGAAIVTYRLVEALRGIGVDARMLVCEKMSDSDFVCVCAPSQKIQYCFLKERLNVFLHNGFNRKDLFKVDPATDGLPLWRHPWVEDADAVLLGWVNQGMLSLNGVRKICQLGKPVVWIMHDMWNMTGICHHAGDCRRYLSECGNCPLLGRQGGNDDMSCVTWDKKARLYCEGRLRFVAVSTWLAEKALESGLMMGIPVAVIPNPFKLDLEAYERGDVGEGEKVGLLFGAARIDDPIKGLGVLKRALEILVSDYPEVAEHLRVVTFGGCKEPESLDGFAVEHQHLGFLKGQEEVRNAYKSCSIVVSTSDFETLPGTLVEGQAYGCIPVALDHGGQRDIVDHEKTGWLAAWSDSAEVRAARIAEGILWGYKNRNNDEIRQNMRKSVGKKFNAPEVAQRILDFTFQK